MSTNGFTFPCTLHPNCQVNDAGVHIDVRLERSLQPLETPTTPEGWEELAKNTPFKGMGKQIYEMVEELKTPSELEILWKRLNRQGIYCHMPIKWTEFEQAIERLMVKARIDELTSIWEIVDEIYDIGDTHKAMHKLQERIRQLSNTKGETK